MHDRGCTLTKLHWLAANVPHPNPCGIDMATNSAPNDIRQCNARATSS